MNWDLEEKRIEFSFCVLRKLVRNIWMKAYWNTRCQYLEPRYDKIYFEGLKWLNKL